MVGSPKAVPTFARSIPSLNVPAVHDAFAHISTRQAAPFDVNAVHREIPKARIIHVFASNFGITKNDIYMRPVTREVVHSGMVTPFEDQHGYRNSYNKADCDEEGNPFHQADSAPITLFGQTYCSYQGFTLKNGSLVLRSDLLSY